MPVASDRRYTYIKYDEKVEKQRVASSIAAGVR